ncbi:DUF945 family protein [Vogesella sp. LIG4]|uniref:DUF945 family protein n=1 Tax=Vogesella sp. LIG4 TaxID=1192162 RepID=UPI00081FD5E4|nr:DUF945 family protein [Vogesella sp. LIG4]SCK09569.1 Uncharacterized protein conserved in bacteria [Vogesella sp. LIG4]
MQAMKGVAATLALAAVAWCGIVPGIVGMRSEDKLRSDFAKLSSSAAGSMLTLEQFDRGWFFSTAKARLQLPLANGLLAAEIDYKINQFAIPFVRWSRTDYSIVPLDAAGRPAGEPLHLDMHTIRGVDGSNTTSLSGHDLTLGGPAGTLNFSIDGQLQAKEGQPVSYDLNMPAFSYQIPLAGRADGVTVRGSNIKLSGSLAAGGFAADQPWASQTSQKLDSIEVLAGGSSLLHIGPGHGDVAVQDQGSNVAAHYRSHLSSLSISPPGRQALLLDNIDVDFSYANISKQELIAWQKESTDLRLRLAGQNDPHALQQAMSEMIRRHIGGFLMQSPSFSLDRLAMHTPQGNLAASLAVSFDGKGTTAASITPQWLQQQGKSRVTLKAGLTLDRSLISALSSKAPTPEQAAQAQLTAEAAITQWKGKGWLKDDGKQLSTSLLVDASGIKANGQPFDPATAWPGTAATPAAALPAGAALPPPGARIGPQGLPAATALPPAAATPPLVVQAAAAPAYAPALSGKAATTTTAPPTPPKTRPRPRHHLPGPAVDLRQCLSLASDRAIMRCANR